MKEDVARRCDGVMLAADFAERMQVLRLRRSEEPVPCVGAERHDAGQPPLEVAEAHCAQKSGQITTQGPHGGIVFRSGVHRHDEKNSGARELSRRRVVEWWMARLAPC